MKRKPAKKTLFQPLQATEREMKQSGQIELVLFRFRGDIKRETKTAPPTRCFEGAHGKDLKKLVNLTTMKEQHIRQARASLKREKQRQQQQQSRPEQREEEVKEALLGRNLKGLSRLKLEQAKFNMTSKRTILMGTSLAVLLSSLAFFALILHLGAESAEGRFWFCL